jgi:hypothetical protein
MPGIGSSLIGSSGSPAFVRPTIAAANFSAFAVLPLACCLAKLPKPARVPGRPAGLSPGFSAVRIGIRCARRWRFLSEKRVAASQSAQDEVTWEETHKHRSSSMGNRCYFIAIPTILGPATGAISS